MNLSESRGRCDRGRELPGEWAFEGKPKEYEEALTDARRYTRGECLFAQRSYRLEIGWHRDF